MPDYIKRSYRPFMKAVWKVHHPDDAIPQPPILVTDHGKSRTVSVDDYLDEQVYNVPSTNLSSCSFLFCQK